MLEVAVGRMFWLLNVDFPSLISVKRKLLLLCLFKYKFRGLGGCQCLQIQLKKWGKNMLLRTVFLPWVRFKILPLTLWCLRRIEQSSPFFLGVLHRQTCFCRTTREHKKKKTKKNTKPTNKQQEGVFTQGGFYSQLPHLQAMTPAKLLKASKGFSWDWRKKQHRGSLGLFAWRAPTWKCLGCCFSLML